MDPMGKIRGQPYGAGSPYIQQSQQVPPTGPQSGPGYPGQGYGTPGPQRYPVGMPGRTPGSMSAMPYGPQVIASYSEVYIFIITYLCSFMFILVMGSI